MKKLTAYALLALMVASCGTPSNRFRMQGRFRSFNQGELYIYDTNRGRARLDTLQVKDGRFSYDVPLSDTLTLSIIFPNYSELPVFAQPGTTVKIEGDATHLKETTVSGTDDNQLMTNFRLAANQLTPPEASSAAAKLIGEHPQSPVSRYLLDKYFIARPDADLTQAHSLAKAMLQAQPQDQALKQLVSQLGGLKAVRVGSPLPAFSAVDMKGRKVSNADVKGKVSVISTWATWNYESQNMQRQLRTLQKNYGAQRLALVSICLDPRLRECRDMMNRDSLLWPQVCDGQMWQTPLVVKLGLADLPDNIVTDASGKVVARSLNLQELKDKLKTLLPK